MRKGPQQPAKLLEALGLFHPGQKRKRKVTAGHSLVRVVAHREKPAWCVRIYDGSSKGATRQRAIRSKPGARRGNTPGWSSQANRVSLDTISRRSPDVHSSQSNWECGFSSGRFPGKEWEAAPLP